MEWKELLNRHGAALILYARQKVGSHADAEDAVQEGFVRLWKSGALEGKGYDEAVPYLFQSVKRACQDYLRSNVRRVNREKKSALENMEMPVFEDTLQSRERTMAIEKALSKLPEEQKEVLVMKLWGNMTFQDIAGVLDVPANTAASRYRYAIEALRRSLELKEIRNG